MHWRIILHEKCRGVFMTAILGTVLWAFDFFVQALHRNKARCNQDYLKITAHMFGDTVGRLHSFMLEAKQSFHGTTGRSLYSILVLRRMPRHFSWYCEGQQTVQINGRVSYNPKKALEFAWALTAVVKSPASIHVYCSQDNFSELRPSKSCK